MGFIDEQVVKMRFDNDGFEKGVSDTISSLEKLNHSVESLGSGSASSALQSIQHSLEQINFTSLNNAIDEVNSRFSTMGIAAARVIQNITDKVESMAESLANALTVKSLKIGFSEYEQVMDISKVIMYNTSASAEEIKGAVRDLQSYADRTIFNYNDLTGVFSNWVTMAGSLEQSGVKLEEAVEGLANMIALSGKGTGEFSRIGQASSKVFSQGYMTRMTMMQFMRNGALTKAFKDAIEPAVKKVGDYEKYLRAMAASNGDLMTATSAQTAKKDSDWFTAEVFAEVMKTYSDKSTDLGARASGAAETVATPSQLVSVTYEAIATGISRMFESIFGDMKEAPEFLSHLSFLLNGDDKVPGILSGFFLDVGSFFEEWHDLGGREDTIQGLFDAFEGLQNIVESVGIVFSNFFPGLTPEKLAEISEGFANNASRFKEWTENLRASFGDFTRWDFWFEEKLEQVPKETTVEMDEDVVIDAFLNTVQSTYGGLITEFIDQFNNSKYVKSIKDNSEAGYHYTKDISAINAAIKKYNGGDSFERFMQYWTGVITEEELNDIFYENGVKNAEHFDQVSRDTAEVAALIEILNENGIDGNELLQQIRDELAIKNTEYETKRTRTPHHKARVIEWQEADWQQSDFVDILDGVFSVLALIRDAASSLYNNVVKPMISSITSGVFMSALEVLSSIGAHLFEFYHRIKDSDIINKFFKGIYNFITENTNLASFFSSITVTLIQLDNIIWDVINGFTDFMGVIAQNSVFQTVIYYLSTIWNIISPFISNNLKTGGVVGGFLGALKGALTGFFTGGPLGMIFGALKGGASGFLKGGLFGVLIDVIKYLEANGPKVKYILSQVFGIVSNLVGSFTSGLFSESGIFGGISNFFSTLKKTVSDIKSGAVDPLDAIVGFLKSDAVKNGLTTLQEKIYNIGSIINEGIENFKVNFIEHFPGITDALGRLVDILTDSAFYSAISTFKDIVIDFIVALVEGFTGSEIKRASDDLATTISTINTALTGFKADDKYKTILDFIKDVGKTIRKIPTYIGHIAKYVSGLFGKDSVGNIIFSGLASILLPKNKDTENAEITEEMANEAQEAATEAVKEATNTAQEAAAEAVEEVAESAEKTTDAVKSGGILSSVGNFILDLFGTTVHADELEGAEEGLQTANDAINTIGQTADNVNKNTETVKQANIGVSMFENFSKGLSTFLNVLSGTLTGLLAGGGIALLIGLLTVVQGFGTVFSILGNYNLVLVAKVIKTVALVLGVALLGIIGLANTMASEGGEERVSKAVTYVEGLITIIGLMAAVITAIQVFGTKPSLGQTVAANPFTALQEFAKGMAKAFEALVNNVGIFAVVAGVIGGIIMIINALTKLAGFSSLKIEKITDLVTNLSLILGGVAILLVLMSKMGGKGSGNDKIHIQADMDPVMYAAPILMVAASIKLIIDAVSELVGLMNNKDIKQDSLKTAGWIVAGIAAGMAVVIAAIAALSKEASSIGIGNGGVTVQGKSGNVFSAAAAIVAITFAISGVVDAIGKLHDKLINKEGVITEDKLSFIVASVGMIALLMVAIGQAIKMMGGTTTGPTDIKFGASVAMIAMVVAVQGLIGAITDLAKTFKKDLGNGVSVLNILSAIGTVLGMMWGVSDSIGNMKDSKINLGTSVAMIAMVLAIKGLIAEITNLAKFYMANVNTLGEFASVIGSIGTVLISLSTLGTEASGMKLQKGEKSGLGNALAMLAMVGAVLGILSMVQEVAKAIEKGNLTLLIEGLAAVEGILWSLAAIANFLKVTEVSKDSKKSTNVLAILGIVAAVTAALTFLNADGVIDDADKALKIAQSMAAIIAALAAMTFVISKVGATAGNAGAGVVAMWKVAGGLALIFTAMAGAVGGIGALVANHHDGTGLGSKGRAADLAEWFESWGQGLLTAAGFLGDLAARFKEHSMVVDSETIKNSMEALGGGAEELNAAVEAVTPENFLKIQEVLEAFDGLTTAMMNFAVSNGGVSIPANMFENLGNDLKAFAPLFEEFCKSIAALDNTIEKDYGIESFGSTTLNDYVELVKTLLSVDAGDTFTSGLLGSTKFSGMKNSFDDIAEGVGAFIDGCETIQTKLDGGEDGKGKKADIKDFDKYIDFINQVAGIKFEEYNGTGWMSSAGANFETLGTGVNTFLNSIEKVEVTDGFNNVIAIMEKLRDNFGDKTATNVYENLTQIGQGAGNFATSVLAAFSTDIGKIDDDSPEEKMEKLLTLTEFFNSFAWVMEAGQNLKKSGMNLILGLLEGILEKVPLIGMSGEEVAKAFIDAFHEASDEHSPSVEMFTAGVYLILGLVNGIDESLSLVKESGKSVFENFKEAFFNAAKEKGIVPTDLTKNLMGSQIISMLKNKDYKGVANKLKQWQHLQDPIKDRNPKTAKKEEQEEKKAEKKEKQEVLKDVKVKQTITPEGEKIITDFRDEVTETNKNVEEATNETAEALQNINDKTPEVPTVEEVQAQLAEQEKTLEDINNIGLDLLTDEDFEKAMEAYATEANMDAYESWFQQVMNGSNTVGDQIMDTVGSMFDGWKDPDSIIGNTMDSINGFIFGDDDKKGLIGQLKDELAEGIVHPLEDLLNAGLSESTINKLLESDLFNSFFENSFLSDITNIDTFKNLLYSSTNIEDLLNNIKEQFPSLDLSSIGLEDLSNELLAFSNDAHYMGGADIENNLVDQIDELLGMLDSEGNYIGDINGSLSGVRSELSNISDALGTNGTVTSAIEDAGDATDTTKAITNAVEEAKVDPKITEMAFRVIRGEFGNNPDRQRLLEEAGYSYAVIQNEVNRLLGNGFRYQTTQEDVNRTLQALGGVTQSIGTPEQLATVTEEAIKTGMSSLVEVANDNQNLTIGDAIDKLNFSVEKAFDFAVQRAAATLSKKGYADSATLVQILKSVRDKDDFEKRVEEAVKKVGNYEQYQKAMEATNNIYRAVSKSQAGDNATWFTKDVMAELFRGYGLNEDIINRDILNIDPHAVQIIKNIEQIPTAQEKLNDLMDELTSANGTLAAKEYESALTELKDVYNDAKKIAKENGYVFASSKVRKAMDDAKQLSELAKKGLDQIEEEEAGNNGEELNKEIRDTRKELKRTLNTTLTELMTEWPELTDNINHIRELSDSGNLKGALEELKDFSKKLNGKAVALNDREKHTFENEFLRAQSRIDSGSPERAEDSLKKIYNGTKHMIYSLDDQADGVLNKTKETENTLKTIQSLTERSDTGLSDSKDAMKKMWEMSQLDEHYKLDKKSNGWWQTESEKVEENYKYTKHALELLQDEYEKSGAKMETQAIRNGKAYLDEFENMIAGADRLSKTTFQNAEEQDRIVKNRVAKMRDTLTRFVEDCGKDYPELVSMAEDAIKHLDDDNLENMRDFFNAFSGYVAKDVEEKTNEYSNLGDKLAYIEEKLASGDADFALVAIQELNGQIQELSDELFTNIEATKEHVKTVVAEVYDSVSGELISKIYDDGTEVFEKLDEEVDKRLNAPKYSDAIVEILDPESGDLLSTVLADGTEIFEAGKEAGKNYATGIDEGFTQQAPSSGEHIAKLVHGSVIDKANAVLGINSPSKEFFAMGEYCMMGFLLGFSQYLGDVETASGQLSDAAMSGFNQMQDYFTKLGDWMNGDDEITPQISPVLELDGQSADLGQLMTGQALLTINGVQIAGLDSLYDLINKSIESDRENAQAIVDAIGATRQDFLTLKDAIQGMKVTIDKKKLVGEIFSDIDTKMGKNKALKARSV